jgi:tetratricopeptide (TPR) repeat protein
MEEPAGNVHPFAYVLSAAFMVWMLMDAWKRRAPLHWYFIIVVMPLGAVFYFVLVKLRGGRDAARGSSMAPPVATAPSPGPELAGAGELDRADELEEREQYLDAEPLYRVELTKDASNKRALHGLGRCLLGQGRANEALAPFETLMELDRAFANYGAALDYADALWAAGMKRDTIELLERLADVTGRMNHRLALGHYCAEFGNVERARREIERAIRETEGASGVLTRRQQQWFDLGQQMLADLDEKTVDDLQ